MPGCVDQLTGTFDPTWGGFGQAPKFPPATSCGCSSSCTTAGDERALQMVRRTLDGMARGGMYDQIGGGFSRYSTDDQWLVPHFEKMLYDNALLMRAYLEGYQVTGDPFYRTIAMEVLDYILREMTAPEGGFYSATDADSEGVEGKFFVWTRAEFDAVLGPDAALAASWYDVTPMGNWEGHSIPRTPRCSPTWPRSSASTRRRRPPGSPRHERGCTRPVCAAFHRVSMTRCSPRGTGS